jgi:hypothetical protein
MPPPPPELVEVAVAARLLCSGWEADFRRDGFAVFEAALSPAARAALADEILQSEASAAAFAAGGAGYSSERGAGAIDHCGPYADALLDAPLIQELLGRVFEGGRYEVCHTTYSARPPGRKGGGLHQDFAFGPSPWCEPGAEARYQSISLFVYPLGFARGDGHLRVVPGSCRVSAFDLLAGPTLADTLGQPELVERFRSRHGLAPRELELPPGSFLVCDNRTWHAVADRPRDSPQPFRLFRNYVFKTAGSAPHQSTQPIPPQWLEGATEHRRMLFGRPPGKGRPNGDWGGKGPSQPAVVASKL